LAKEAKIRKGSWSISMGSILFGLSVAATMAFAASPAKACACGIYLPLDGEGSVSAKHVLLRWEGQTEDIVITLGVLGSTREAAVIFPGPLHARDPVDHSGNEPCQVLTPK
jgi:hypothetical protein